MRFFKFDRFCVLERQVIRAAQIGDHSEITSVANVVGVRFATENSRHTLQEDACHHSEYFWK